ncbi:hypothetical protein [Okeania sp. SIO2B3]|nr:hypothetical protein [Okeania sp. SIO2B3]NET42867.1 hypothetical protein [Okeania sp. SIO2B3]
MKNIDKTSSKGLTQSQTASQNTTWIALGWPVEFRASDRDSTVLAELE